MGGQCASGPSVRSIAKFGGPARLWSPPSQPAFGIDVIVECGDAAKTGGELGEHMDDAVGSVARCHDSRLPQIGLLSHLCKELHETLGIGGKKIKNSLGGVSQKLEVQGSVPG